MGGQVQCSPEEDSPRAVYAASCDTLGCKKNSYLMQNLPRDIGWNCLTVLDLSLNFVGRLGVLPVLEVVRRSPNITRLCLADNFLNNGSVKEIVQNLVDHPRLEYLDLSRNPISHAAGKLLSRFVVQNAVVHTVLLEDTLINPALIRIIQKNAASKQVDRDQDSNGTCIVERREEVSTPLPETKDPEEIPVEQREEPLHSSHLTTNLQDELAPGFAWREFMNHASIVEEYLGGIAYLDEASRRPGAYPPCRRRSSHETPKVEESDETNSLSSSQMSVRAGEMINLVFMVAQRSEDRGLQGLPLLWKLAKDELPDVITSDLQKKDGLSSRPSTGAVYIPPLSGRLHKEDEKSLDETNEFGNCFLSGLNLAVLASEKVPEREFFALKSFIGMTESVNMGTVWRSRSFTAEDFEAVTRQRLGSPSEVFPPGSTTPRGWSTPRGRQKGMRDCDNPVTPRSSQGTATTAHLGSHDLLFENSTNANDEVENLNFLLTVAQEQQNMTDLPALCLLGNSQDLEPSFYALKTVWDLVEEEGDREELWHGLRSVMNLLRTP